MDLKCRKLNCVNNNCYSCMKKNIKVTNNCECASFEKNKKIKENQIQDASKNMFETAPEIHPYRHKKNVDITCNACCLFNDKCNCVANGICITEDGKLPICNTFINK